jgi:hypothetical protein
MTPDPVAMGGSGAWRFFGKLGGKSTNQPEFIGACSLSLSLVTGLNAGKRVPGLTLSGSPA